MTLYFVYLAIGQFVTIYIATVGFNYVGEHITAKVRGHYLAAVLRQNMAYFDLLGAGEIVSRTLSYAQTTAINIPRQLESRPIRIYSKTEFQGNWP